MIFLMIIGFILSLVLTGYLRHYALSKNIVDIPNHRSSHVIPTPRVGGIAFVIVFFMAIPCLVYTGLVTLSVALALFSGGFIVALLGFIDDHGHVPTHLRLVGHFVASAIVLYFLGGMPSITILGWVVPTGIGLTGLALVYLVWLLNLYNFMDGIDGLAALEAVSVCLGISFLYVLNGDWELIGLPLTLAAVVTGFLYWNFPPARIFMGDVGSGFLGLMLGIMTIQGARVGKGMFWGWLILLGVFIVDATVTLLFRLFQGMKISEAHCDHAYQHAARRYGSHRLVTLGVLIITIFWLLPIAILVRLSYLQGFIGILIAYFPLFLLAFLFKAGRRGLF